MAEELSISVVRAWLETVEASKEFHYLSMLSGQKPEPKIDARLRRIFFELAKHREVKSSGRRDGIYQKTKRVEPIKWWKMDSVTIMDFRFPWGHEDSTAFDVDEQLDVFPGDLWVIAGRSNYGKTALALNILGENVDRHKCILMGSEYSAADGKISPKFKRRLDNMKWVKWLNGNGEAKFTLLPVSDNFEDYIEPDKINIVDWINLPGEYYMIDHVMKKIKDRIGNGLGIVVIQKGKGAEYGEGGERTERYADLYMTIDSFGQFESLLTIGKVKAPKGRLQGRAWAFKIVDYGANLHNIREVSRCSVCKGKGLAFGDKCKTCEGKGWKE